MKISVVTSAPAPASEPVSLSEAKAQLRIADADTTYDTEITNIITQSRQWIENNYGISLITQTRKQVQDNFYENWPLPLDRTAIRNYYVRFAVKLLSPPVQSISAFTYIDTNGNSQSLTVNTDYGQSGLITPVTGGIQHIPITRLWPINAWPGFKLVPEAVQITYVAGFGDATQVPGPIKRAILMLITHFFENRSEEITGERVAQFDMTIDRVMSTYQIFQHDHVDA